MKKRIVSMLLVASLIATTFWGCGNSTKQAQESSSAQSTAELDKTQGKYPINYDLTKLFKDESEWQSEYDRLNKWIDGVEKYKGTLNSAKGICDFYNNAIYCNEALDMVKLDAYANLRSERNGSDSEAKNMLSKSKVLQEKYSKALAFADPEIFKIPLEKRKTIFADPVLQKYKYSLRGYVDEDAIHYSEEQMLLSQF